MVVALRLFGVEAAPASLVSDPDGFAVLNKIKKTNDGTLSVVSVLAPDWLSLPPPALLQVFQRAQQMASDWIIIDNGEENGWLHTLDDALQTVATYAHPPLFSSSETTRNITFLTMMPCGDQDTCTPRCYDAVQSIRHALHPSRGIDADDFPILNDRGLEAWIVNTTNEIHGVWVCGRHLTWSGEGVCNPPVVCTLQQSQDQLCPVILSIADITVLCAAGEPFVSRDFSAFRFYEDGLRGEIMDRRVEAFRVAGGSTALEEIPLSDSTIAELHGHYFFAAFRRLSLHLQDKGVTDPRVAATALDSLKLRCNATLREIMRQNSVLRKTFCAKLFHALHDPVRAKYIDGDGLSRPKGLHKFYQATLDAWEEYLLKCCGGVQKFVQLWEGMESLEARVSAMQAAGVEWAVPAGDLVQCVASLVAEARAIMKGGLEDEEKERMMVQQRLARHSSHIAAHAMAQAHHVHADTISQYEPKCVLWEKKRKQKLQKLMLNDNSSAVQRRDRRAEVRWGHVQEETAAWRSVERLATGLGPSEVYDVVVSPIPETKPAKTLRSLFENARRRVHN
jgi:hypothetical protein